MTPTYQREDFPRPTEEDTVRVTEILHSDPENLTLEERQAVARLSVSPFVSLREMLMFLHYGEERPEMKASLARTLARLKTTEEEYLQAIGPDCAIRHPAKD